MQDLEKDHPLVAILRDNPGLLEYVCRMVGGQPSDAAPLLKGRVTKNLREKAKFFRNLDL